jgi:hypothetical protein
VKVLKIIGFSVGWLFILVGFGGDLGTLALGVGLLAAMLLATNARVSVRMFRLFVIATVVVIALWDGLILLWIVLSVKQGNFQGDPGAGLLNLTVKPTLLALALLAWLFIRAVREHSARRRDSSS